MDELESCEVSLTIKQLKLAVKFPCKLTFTHMGRPISQEIQSNSTNLFTVNKDVFIKEDKQKEFLQIIINLATDKGGNIMAGILKMSFRDLSASQGQSLIVPLQKCLDANATCFMFVKSVKMNRSRVKKIGNFQEKKQRTLMDSKYETKSEMPVFEGFKEIKSRLKYNDAQTYLSKRVGYNNLPSPTNNNFTKDKALSTVGMFKAVKDISFEREELNSRFKHLNKRVQEQDNKTLVPPKYRDQQQVLKSTMEANQRALKLQITKLKVKLEQSQLTVEQKNKQMKTMKDQIAELNKQVAEKHYMLQEISSRTIQISKLEDSLKNIIKDSGECKGKIIELQRQLEQERNSKFVDMSRLKQEMEKRQFQFLKLMNDKNEEVKSLSEENQYKINQIGKMRSLIQDLEKTNENKTYQFDKNMNQEKNQHNKTRNALTLKINQLQEQIKTQQNQYQQTNRHIRTAEEQIDRLNSQIRKFEESLYHTEKVIQEEVTAKERIQEEKRRVDKNEEELLSKLRLLQKDLLQKDKEIQQLLARQIEQSNSNKKRIAEANQKNKIMAGKVQQMENRISGLTSSEQKLKRMIQLLQKQNRNVNESQKSAIKNSKLKDERILQLEKELSDLQNKNVIRQNLNKKDAQYKTGQIDKLNTRIQQLQFSLQKENEDNEEKRIDLLKQENKLKLLQENNIRLNQYVKELKLSFSNKDQQNLIRIKQLQQQNKQMDIRLTQTSKEQHNLQIQRTNLNTQISKFQRINQSINDKLDRLKKKDIEQQNTIKSLSKELSQKIDELNCLQIQYKNIQNDFQLLQADKHKHQKITTIISQEKDTAKNDIGRLKKEIEKRQVKQEEYLSQIKNCKEQITKNQLKIVSITKETQKFKNNISEAIKTLMISKQAILDTDLCGSNNMQASRSMLRSKTRKGNLNQYSFTNESGSQLKYTQVIQNFAKEAQQVVASLSDQLRKVKRDRDNIEKNLNNLTERTKMSEQQQLNMIKQLEENISSMQYRESSQIQQYEEKVLMLEKDCQKKDKTLAKLKEEIDQLHINNQNQKQAHDMTVSDFLSKINSLKNKLNDCDQREETQAQVFVHLQEQLADCQTLNAQLNLKVTVQQESLAKKEKALTQKYQEFEEQRIQFQNIKKIKSELAIKVLTLSERIALDNQKIERMIAQSKEEDQRKIALKIFNSDLLKQKQTLLKSDIDKTQKIYSLQEQVQTLMIEVAQKNEELIKLNAVANEMKQSGKTSLTQVASLRTANSQIKILYERQKERVRDRERKLIQKQNQIQNITSNFRDSSIKYQNQIADINQEIVEAESQICRLKEEYSAKLNDFESQIKKLKETERKQNESNLSLEQQIFFEKQNNSINITKYEDLKETLSNIQTENHRLEGEISKLIEELKQKQMQLYNLSGKLYAHDNKLDEKDQELKSKVQKVDLEWRYKLEEICEQYEQRLQIIQRQKNYVRTGMEEFNNNVEKLEKEKTQLKCDFEKQKQIYQSKIKKMEEEKLTGLIAKNRQIQKLRQSLDQAEEKERKKEFDIKTIQEDRKKSQERNKQLRKQIEKLEEKKNQLIRTYEKEIDQMKRKEGQFKRFKDALKNNQWTIEREIKKNIQNCTKSLTGTVKEESKGQIVEMMRSFESVLLKLACPIIDQL